MTGIIEPFEFLDNTLIVTHKRVDSKQIRNYLKGALKNPNCPFPKNATFEIYGGCHGSRDGKLEEDITLMGELKCALRKIRKDYSQIINDNGYEGLHEDMVKQVEINQSGQSDQLKKLFADMVSSDEKHPKIIFLAFSFSDTHCSGYASRS